MNGLTFNVLAITLMASTGLAADPLADNQQFLRTLREQSAARQQLPAALLPGSPTTPELDKENKQWMEHTKRQLIPVDRARSDALYFLSFSIPEEGLKHMVQDAARCHIPTLINGLIENNFRKTVQMVFRLTRESAQGGIQIDPVQFARYKIDTVPTLIVTCEQGYDRISGNLSLKAALERVAAEGQCQVTATRLLKEAGK